MRNLTVSIDDLEFTKLGLTVGKISFPELKDKISLLYAKEALLKCQRIAKQTGLSKMTLRDINQEIKAVRKNAKNSD